MPLSISVSLCLSFLWILSLSITFAPFYIFLHINIFLTVYIFLSLTLTLYVTTYILLFADESIAGWAFNSSVSSEVCTMTLKVSNKAEMNTKIDAKNLWLGRQHLIVLLWKGFVTMTPQRWSILPLDNYRFKIGGNYLWPFIVTCSVTRYGEISPNCQLFTRLWEFN